jgi:hypothetical protein
VIRALIRDDRPVAELAVQPHDPPLDVRVRHRCPHRTLAELDVLVMEDWPQLIGTVRVALQPSSPQAPSDLDMPLPSGRREPKPYHQLAAPRQIGPEMVLDQVVRRSDVHCRATSVPLWSGTRAPGTATGGATAELGFRESGRRESNPHHQLGRLRF